MPSGVSSLKKRPPREDILAAKLRKQLDAQDFQPGDFVTTEHDLVRTEGLSRTSVRQAVDKLIAEGKLERRPGKGVYVSDTNGNGHKSSAISRLVQVVIPDMAFSQCVELARGAKMAGLSVGVQTQIYDAHGAFDADLETVRCLPKTAAQGAIIASLHHKHFARVLYELEVAGYPFVLVDETLRDITVPSVVADNYQGGYLVGQELIRRGHRRLGFVGFLGADTVRARLEGLRDAMADVDLSLPRAFIGKLRVESLQDWSAEIERATKKILERPNRATAIFFCNDSIAAEGYKVIVSLGLRIPEDVSVVGFDGDPACRLLAPTLATVRQPAREMGAAAMEMLLDLMSSRHTPCAVASTASRSQANGSTVAGDAPIAAAHKAQDDGNALHRVLPVTWQDGDSIGPAPSGFAARTGEQATGEQEITQLYGEHEKPPSRQERETIGV